MTRSITKASKALFLALSAVGMSALTYFGFSLIGWTAGQSAITTGILVLAGGLCAAVYAELHSFRKSAEGTDKEHRERLERVMRMAGLYAWEVDLKTNKATYYDNISELFGHPEDTDFGPEEFSRTLVHPDDRKRTWDTIMVSPDDVDFIEAEFRVIAADGEIRLLKTEARKERDAAGTPIKLIGTTQDITEQRRGEHTLRSRSAIIHETSNTVMVTAPDGTIHDVNPATTRLTGYARTELIGTNIYELWDWAESMGVPVGEMKEGLRAEGRWRAEHIFIHRDGAVIPVETSVFTITDDNDETLERVINIRDISARKEAEQSLRDSERRLAKAQELAQVGSWEMDWATRVWVWSEQMREIFDLGPGDELPTQENFFDQVHPDDVDGLKATIERAQAGIEPVNTEYRIQTAKGREKVLLGTAEYEFNDSGQIVKSLGAVQDITSRRTTGNTLAESERRLSWAQEKAALGSWERDLATGSSVWSEQLFRILDLDPDTPLESGTLFYEFVHPSDVEELTLAVNTLTETGEPMNQEYRIRTANGEEKTVIGYGEIIRDRSGKPIAVGGTVQDITERKAAEKALAHSEKRLAWAQEKAHLGSWDLNIKTGKLFWSDELFRILGEEPNTTPKISDGFYKYVHPADVEPLRQAVDALIETSTPMDIEYRVRTRQGVERRIHGFAEVSQKEDGEIVAIGGTLQDISEQHETERKLAQSMKMDTVGQLSAGVAHDFNNLLAVIMGNLELIQMRVEGKVKGSAEIHDFASRALEASANGTALVKRLLAYSRRQMLFPERTRINELVGRTVELLKRTLGRNIQIDFEASNDLWDSEIDAGQLEAALTNLALNARDAMPKGGRLSITTHNVSGLQAVSESVESGARGQFVCIDVTDTGTGMPQDVIDKAVEPFFTTKEVGKGTGLGLSMVYGFVRQSEGIFNITSHEGAGTTVRLFLPRMLPQKAELKLIEQDSPVVNRGKVLIVEDDHDVINVVALQVRELGYQPIEANSVEEALASLEAEADIQLLLTDVILGPGPNGVDLALKAQEIRPGLPVLCMSGFVEPSKFEEYAGSSTFPFIGKPFTTVKLNTHLHDVLDAKAEDSSLPRSS